MPEWTICPECGTTDTMACDKDVDKTYDTERDPNGLWYLVHVYVYRCQIVGCDHTHTRRDRWLVAPNDSRLWERRWQAERQAHAIR